MARVIRDGNAPRPVVPDGPGGQVAASGFDMLVVVGVLVFGVLAVRGCHIDLDPDRNKPDDQHEQAPADTLDECMAIYEECIRDAATVRVELLRSGKLTSESQAADWWLNAMDAAERKAFMPLVLEAAEFGGESWTAEADAKFYENLGGE